MNWDEVQTSYPCTLLHAFLPAIPPLLKLRIDISRSAMVVNWGAERWHWLLTTQSLVLIGGDRWPSSCLQRRVRTTPTSMRTLLDYLVRPIMLMLALTCVCVNQVCRMKDGTDRSYARLAHISTQPYRSGEQTSHPVSMFVNQLRTDSVELWLLQLDAK
jgi:hypothetical protein